MPKVGFLAGLCVTMAVTGSLHAQAVRGVLVERGSGRPVRGGFVVLLDDSNAEVVRALTDDAGRFLIRAPQAGQYRLQSKRIGFRLFVSEPLTLEADQTVAYRAQVEAVPAMLPPVIVEGRPQCGSRGEAGSITARLWEEAREALAAVSWTSGEGRHRYQLLNFFRQYGPVGRMVLKDSSWTVSGYSESPFTSLPAEHLAEAGYVVAGWGGDTVDYYAPDANVLLSDAFLNTHCFTARDGAGANAGLVGLAFQPAPGRVRADVDGVLWFDRTNAELRYLAFEYTNLPPWLPQGPLGGRVEFMRLSAGAWIVRHWWIRMAVMGRVVYRDTGREPEPRVVGFRERGGQVTTITTSRGALAYSAREAILEGTVFDSTRGAFLTRATVFLEGRADSARTDDRGAYALPVPVEGMYGVSFRHPRLDSLGFRPEATPVMLELGARTVLPLAIPGEARLLANLCRAKPLGPEERVLIGVVRDQSDVPIPGATVGAGWQLFGGGRGASITIRHERLEAVAVGTGRYVLCGVPLGLVTVRASVAGTAAGATVTLRFVEEGVWVDDQRYRNWPGRIWTQDFSLRP